MDDGVRVIFNPMNRMVTVHRGTLLLDALRDAGIPIESICGGKGLCRKCKVILTQGNCETVLSEGKPRLSLEERRAGYHFACQVRVLSDCEFTIPIESRIDSPQILLSSEVKIQALSPSVKHYPVDRAQDTGMSFAQKSIRLRGYSGPRPRISDSLNRQVLAAEEPVVATLSLVQSVPEIIGITPLADMNRLSYGIALDLGTTTVVGILVDLSSGEIVETESNLNRQITYGEEVITRIGFAHSLDGRKKLQDAALESINSVISGLVSQAVVDRTDIIDMTIGGNTVMNHLLCGIDPVYLEMANAPVSRDPIIMKATGIGLSIHPEASVYCLPNVSRFVGGDAIGDVVASGMHRSPDISLLIDLGTNGEIILGNQDWIASVSCASGPAFEGAGMTFGMRAMKGAIEHATIDSATSEVICTVIGNIPPRGICGSGIIDAAAGMWVAGVLDFAGKLILSHPCVRMGAEGPEYILVPKEKAGIARDIVITQRDIDYFMDSKAAACGAIGVLLKKYKLTTADILHVYLAGAFGAYTNMANAVRFGILPEFQNARFHPIGNGSLSGAYAALLSRQYRRDAEITAERMVYIDLLVDTDFIEEYSAALYIPGKSELFPSYYQQQKR